MTRIIRRGWAARKKTPRGQQGAAKGHVSILSCDLLTDCGGPVASPRCSLTVVASPPFSFPLSMRPYRSLSCNMRARRFLLPTILTRRTLSVTNVTSLVFIFFMSDIRNAIRLIVFFETATLVAAHHANITTAEHAAFPTHAQWC